MKTLPAALQTHLGQQVTTLAVCWRIERPDGVLILGTEHDQDITIDSGTSPPGALDGTYYAQAGITGSSVISTDDMSVDNLDVEGATDDGSLTVVDLSAADIEAGLMDSAAVTLFMVNWESPDDGQIILRTGTLGAIRRTSEGQYMTELRGLAQRLTQNIVRTYGASCDAELGDSRCTVDLQALTVSGTVTGVTSNRQFSASVSVGSPAPDPGYFNGGLVTWLTGENAGFQMEVKQDEFGSPPEILLFLPMVGDVQIGDTFTMAPGCDKSAAMCKGQFANLANFRGHGAWVPGVGELMAFGGQTAEKKATSSQLLQWPKTQIP